MLLTEKSEIRQTSLTADGDSFRMKVPVLQSDIFNSNKRRYPLAVVKAAVEELRSKLQKRIAYGSTRHEKNLEIDQVSHIIEDVELDEKGLASAVIRIFNTARGKNLSAIIRGGGSLGVSARGAGDVDESGNVKPGYKLLGLDFVTDPSFNFHVGKEALMFESRELEEDGPMPEELMLTKEQLANRYLGALVAGFRGDFESYRKLFEKKGN
ncbi:MAG: hypothetical protein ABFD52_09330 [Acidobacteriota bacterium]